MNIQSEKLETAIRQPCLHMVSDIRFKDEICFKDSQQTIQMNAPVIEVQFEDKSEHCKLWSKESI